MTLKSAVWHALNKEGVSGFAWSVGDADECERLADGWEETREAANAACREAIVKRCDREALEKRA